MNSMNAALELGRPHPGRIEGTAVWNAVVPLGRVLFSAIFVASGISHFTSPVIAYAAGAGVPVPGLLVPASGVLALLGGLSVALGYRANVGAWLLVVFLVPITLTMHAFWAVDDPFMAQIQQAMFMKNLALLGGALLVAGLGAGPVSLDARSPVGRMSGRGNRSVARVSTRGQ
jgi:putative oxidoreductase